MTDSMLVIHTQPQLLERLNALAAATHRSRDGVIEDALEQYIETQAWQMEGIAQAITALDAGQGISHAQVLSEADKLLKTLTK